MYAMRNSENKDPTGNGFQKTLMRMGETESLLGSQHFFFFFLEGKTVLDSLSSKKIHKGINGMHWYKL